MNCHGEYPVLKYPVPRTGGTLPEIWSAHTATSVQLTTKPVHDEQAWRRQ
jgi:hypothetical protein